VTSQVESKAVGVEAAFHEIFESVTSDAQANLEAAQANSLQRATELGALRGGGTIGLDIQLDANGNYSTSYSKYGAGVTVSISAWLTDPDDLYDISVQSSDGGGGKWFGVNAGQHLDGKISTSFWHTTTISVSVHAHTARNTVCHGMLQYSY
jgi:hypothetical protein